MDREMTDLNQVVLDLNQKIDALTHQVAYLIEQAQIAERSRRSREELVETMMPVAKDAMRLASNEFEEIQDYLQVEDLLRMEPPSQSPPRNFGVGFGFQRGQPFPSPVSFLSRIRHPL